MVGNVALLLAFHDLRGLPGRWHLFPPARVWMCCPSPWLPDAATGGPVGCGTRFYFAPIEDAIG